MGSIGLGKEDPSGNRVEYDNAYHLELSTWQAHQDAYAVM
jgi:hypothetical protein